MTEKELRKLGRAELLELLLEQAREFEALEQRLNAAEAALQSQQLQLETCGSIAEASLKLRRRRRPRNSISRTLSGCARRKSARQKAKRRKSSRAQRKPPISSKET